MQRIQLTFLLVFFVLIGGPLSAQTPFNIRWGGSYGSSNDDRVDHVQTDAQGNVYIAGTFQNQVDFDPGQGTYNETAVGNEDAYLLKLDAFGAFQWVVPIGGPDVERVDAMYVDAQGNSYLVGRFRMTVDFEAGPGTTDLTSNGSWDGYVVKYDANGVLQWAKQLGGTDFDVCAGITQLSGGDLIISGAFQSTVDFDLGAGTQELTASANSTNCFLLRTDANASSVVWVHKLTGSGSANGLMVERDASDQIFWCGEFSGALDLNPGAGITTVTTNSSDAGYLVKFDANGGFLWGRPTGTEEVEDLAVTPSGRPLVLRQQMGNNVEMFLSQWTAGGVFAFSLHWTSPSFGNLASEVIGEDVYADASGIYVTGSFWNRIDFDPDAGTSNLDCVNNGGFMKYDAFVLHLDQFGGFDWVKGIGDDQDDFGSAIHVDPQENVYLGGEFLFTTDIDPNPVSFNLTSNGNEDAFVAKYGQCLHTNNNFQVDACEEVTVNGQTYTSSGSYSQILTNAAGCDSFILVDVFITTIDTTVSFLSGETLAATGSGTAYQWLSCPSMTPIPGATDSTFTATTSGSYAVAITDGNCTDTSGCHTIIITSQEEALSQNADMALWPNPSRGELHADVSWAAQPAFYEVYSTRGELLQRAAVDGRATQDVRVNLPEGLYLLRVTDAEGQVRVKRFLIAEE
ncbi:MAG: T9SS type A sorting domain-containing protein [Bacteroidota bacterium]